MLLTLLFGLINAVMSFVGDRVFKFSGFDIAPAAIVICAWHGENILFSSLVLTLSYSFVTVKEMRYLWITLPATILIGYLALVIPNGYILLAIYHVVGLSAAYLFEYFGVNYMLFIGINVAVNVVVLRIYGLF